MELRGERKCTACGERWSYYETGDVACPTCGSVRSVGVGERAEHTGGAATLDLSGIQGLVDTEPVGKVGRRASEQAAEYLRAAGFVDVGRLRPLSDTYLAATELRRVGARLDRAMRVDEAEELYFLKLLGGADDNRRPGPSEVPDGLRGERGLAVAAAAEAYTSDLRRVYEEPTGELASALSAVRTRRKRIEALNGEVDPREAERVVRTLRDVYGYLAENDETALARASERFK